MSIQILVATLRTETPVNALPRHVRGFFARHQPDNLLLHQHQGTGDAHQFVYIYPRVQYRVRAGTIELFGIAEGPDAVEHATRGLSLVDLAGRVYQVVGIDYRAEEIELYGCSEPRSYRFVSPWLALNQKNFGRFRRSGPGERTFLLQRILVGNILSMCKSLGIYVAEHIAASIDLQTESCPVKDQDMLGFAGVFAVNFAIPPGFALGHLVSIGYGEIAAAQQGESPTADPACG